MLQFLRLAFWETRERLPADFVFGRGACALFCSLKHFLAQGPASLESRTRELEGSADAAQYKLRVLLVWVDVLHADGGAAAPDEPLARLAEFSVQHGLSMLCAFSLEECARYLETFKSYEFKGAELLQARRETEYVPVAQEALSKVRHVNRSDAVNLLAHFGSAADLFKASLAELQAPAGIGDRKARALFAAFATPFAGAPRPAAAGAADGRMADADVEEEDLADEDDVEGQRAMMERDAEGDDEEEGDEEGGEEGGAKKRIN